MWQLEPNTSLQLAAKAKLPSVNVMAFEGGNLAKVVQRSSTQFDLYLRNDNDDALPPYWRQWWFGKLSHLPTNQKLSFTIKGQVIGGLYMPAYSYDNHRWQLFTEREVSQSAGGELVFSKLFRQSTVYLARYVPYTYSDLQLWLNRIKKNRDITIKSLGKTPLGRPIPQITISNRRYAKRRKSRILVHARTHPGEVGSSFLLEGLVDYALGSSSAAQVFRQKLILDIVPMLNVDGVIAGNNRVTPSGINLESQWYRQTKRPDLLDAARIPKEVELLHAHFLAATKEAAPVTVALNLHSSAGEPDDQVFFFPHFGPRHLGYQAVEASLYNKQRRLIELWQRVQGRAWFNPPPLDGKKFFLTKTMPETWWWENFQDRVMALSIESVYGRAGASQRWVTPDDMRRMGKSLGEALARYHGVAQ